MDDWAAKVDSIYSVFESYDFFKAEVTQFSSFYVNTLENPFCYFNCGGIDRLLCCDIFRARILANSCFPAVATVQTVVVHNDQKYGGAGYVRLVTCCFLCVCYSFNLFDILCISSNVATTSINPGAPLVAVHELGHSFFDFYDEYTYISGTPSSAFNCDINAGCPKWNDMIDDYPSICSNKGCAGGNYYVGESNSFMQALNYNVGPVLTRYTCCTYYALTGTIPPYCNEFIDKGMGLFAYCAFSGYSSGSGVSLLTQGQKSGRTSFETPSGQKIYLANPAKIPVRVKDIEASTNEMINDIMISSTVEGIEASSNEIFNDIMSSSPQHLKPGFYASSLLDGERDDIEYMVHVKVKFFTGEVKKMYFSKFDVVSVPPSDRDGVDNVHVKRDTINIVYDYDKYGDVASIEVRNAAA